MFQVRFLYKDTSREFSRLVQNQEIERSAMSTSFNPDFVS